ncbi:MAG TPA: hypothetical protein VF682_11895 [Pseudomonas sp.]|jgi:hypothetical protein
MEFYSHRVAYRFHDEPRQHVFDLPDPTLPLHSAALHLLQLHFGDSENSLMMPDTDAAPDVVLHQASLLGISDINCTPVAQ